MDKLQKNIIIILIVFVVIVVAVNFIVRNNVKGADKAASQPAVNNTNSQVSEAVAPESVSSSSASQSGNKPKEGAQEPASPEDSMGYTGGQPLLQ